MSSRLGQRRSITNSRQQAQRVLDFLLGAKGKDSSSPSPVAPHPALDRSSSGRMIKRSTPSPDCQSSSPRSCSTTYSDAQVDCKCMRAQDTSVAVSESSWTSQGSIAMDLSFNQGTEFAAPPSIPRQEPVFQIGAAPATMPTASSADLEAWFAREASFLPSRQLSVPHCTRETVVTWMCNVIVAYGMELETFLLAVNYLDRCLAFSTIPRRQLQLLGAACVWIASKFEEVVPPTAQQVLDMAQRAYSVSEMVVMEAQVMSCLGWNMSVPTSLKFLHSFLVKAQITSRSVLNLAECLVQLAALDASLCAPSTLPSRVASASLCMALAACGQSDVIPIVVSASRWHDVDALASLSQALYARFTILAAPNTPRHCAVSQYVEKQVTINNTCRSPSEAALASLMIPRAAAHAIMGTAPPPGHTGLTRCVPSISCGLGPVSAQLMAATARPAFA